MRHSRKTTATIIALALITVNAAAAGDRVPFHTNGPADNWFIQAGGGANAVLDNGSFNFGGPAATLRAGKWLTPYTAFRLGWQGAENRATDTSNGWFAGDDAFAFHQFQLDWMWDATASLLGYNPGRVLSVRPFVRAGVIITGHEGRTVNELGAGGGIDLDFRITPRLSAGVSASATVAREEAWRDAGKVIAFPTVTAGVTVALGKTGFERHTATVTTVTVPVLRDCGHDALIRSLQNELDSLASVKAAADTVVRTVPEGLVTYFTIDRWDLSQRELYHLEDFAASLPEDAVITLTGHADKETGSRSRNRRLSEERVRTVEAALRGFGFKGTVRTAPMGDTANPFEGRAPKNRCTVITVTAGNE